MSETSPITAFKVFRAEAWGAARATLCNRPETEGIFMEKVAEQPAHEKLRSFDPLASVDMMRYDLQRFGQVLPETRQRVYDEELSYIAEGIDRASCTPFRLSRDENGELVYFDEAKWRPYTSMLLTGMEVAEAEARLDPRRQFLAEWATRDWQIGMQLNSLNPGESMAWHNGYPHDIEERYGAKFMQDRGLKPHRKMGFLYHASCQEDGSVVLQSQTIDRSDPNALAGVDAMLDYDSEVDIDTMLRTYDGHLVKEFGGNFYAGRREAEIDENVWSEIVKNKPLIEYFLDGIEEIAAWDIPRDQLEDEAKKHTYGVWAALKDRLMSHVSHDTYTITDFDVGSQLNPYAQHLIMHEVQRAYRVAASRGDVLVGCGGAIPAGSAGDNLTGPSGEDAFDSIFGKKPSGSSGPESYKFDKKMYCVVCQAPPTEAERKTEAKKLCGPCGICKGCDAKMQAKTKIKSDFASAA